MARGDTVTLDGYQVVHFTERAILARHMKSATESWIPRSVCEAGDRLSIGETDIVVAEWFAEKEGLIF